MSSSVMMTSVGKESRFRKRTSCDTLMKDHKDNVNSVEKLASMNNNTERAFKIK